MKDFHKQIYDSIINFRDPKLLQGQKKKEVILKIIKKMITNAKKLFQM